MTFSFPPQLEVTSVFPRARLSFEWLETRDNPSTDVPGVDPLAGTTAPTAPQNPNPQVYVAPTTTTYDAGANSLLIASQSVLPATGNQSLPAVLPVGTGGNP